MTVTSGDSVRLSIRLPAEVHADLMKRSQEEERSLGFLIRRAVKESLGRYTETQRGGAVGSAPGS